MNIFDQLKGHKVVEANNLQGLRTGHMVAQAKFDGKVGTGGEAYLDNGHILELNEANELVLSATGAGFALLHYSEEHMKFLDNAPLEMFTVTLDGAAYPRAIALYHGDTFTTDNFGGTAPAVAGTWYPVTVLAGVLTVGGTAAADTDKGPIAKKATLPSGEDAIEVVWRGGAN